MGEAIKCCLCAGVGEVLFVGVGGRVHLLLFVGVGGREFFKGYL